VQVLSRQHSMSQLSEMRFSPDNKKILTYCEKEDSLLLWDINSGKVMGFFKPASSQYEFSPDGQSIIIYKEKSFFILNIDDNKDFREIPVSQDVVNFDITKDQKYIVSAGEGIIKIWDY
jgi:WD40 repeat protein